MTTKAGVGYYKLTVRMVCVKRVGKLAQAGYALACKVQLILIYFTVLSLITNTVATMRCQGVALSNSTYYLR